MYLPLILFFLSLAGIIVMVGRKLVLVRNGHVVKILHSHPLVPDLERMRIFTVKAVKKSGYVMIFVVIKSYLLSLKFIKDKWKEILSKITEVLAKKNNETGNTSNGNKEASRYLRVISEYREKIRKMKHKIKEEEGIE